MSDQIVEVLLIVIAVGFPILMIRGLIQMWRNKDHAGSFSSAIGGALLEVDRVVRPSVEHTLEAKNEVKKQRDEAGEK